MKGFHERLGLGRLRARQAWTRASEGPTESNLIHAGLIFKGVCCGHGFPFAFSKIFHTETLLRVYHPVERFSKLSYMMLI